MKKVSFTIAAEQKDKFMELVKTSNLQFLNSINRTTNGYNITLESIGGRPNDVSLFVSILKSSSIIS